MKITFHDIDESLGSYLCGQLPLWLNSANPAPAREQINAGYPFGGWQPLRKAKLGPGNAMYYPGDPPQYPFVTIEFRQERIYGYPHEFWGIVQPDGSAEFARLD